MKNIIKGLEPDETLSMDVEGITCGYVYECSEKVREGSWYPQFCHFGRSLYDCPSVINLREREQHQVYGSSGSPMASYNVRTQVALKRREKDGDRKGSLKTLS